MADRRREPEEEELEGWGNDIWIPWTPGVQFNGSSIGVVGVKSETLYIVRLVCV